MEDFSYWNALGKSFVDLKNNLNLFAPLLLQFLVAVVVLGILFVLNIGILALIINVSFAEFFSSSIWSTLLTKNNIIIMGFMLLADFIILLAAITFFTAGFMGMANEVRLTRKTTFSRMLEYGKKYFSPFFKVAIIKTILQWIPLLIILVAYGVPILNAIVNNSFDQLSLGFFISLIPVILLYIIYSIFIGIVFFFINPIVIENKPETSVFTLIKRSTSFSFGNFGHLILVFLILLLVGVGAAIVITIITTPLELIAELSIIGFFLTVLAAIIRFLVNLIVEVVSTIYMFRAYFAKNQ